MGIEMDICTEIKMERNTGIETWIETEIETEI